NTAGYDLRWSTPVEGLMVGASGSFTEREFTGTYSRLPGYPVLSLEAKTYMMRQLGWYMEYTHGPWRFDGEYRAAKTLSLITVLGLGAFRNGQATPGWFVALSYRVNPHLELGTYRTQYKYIAIDDQSPIVGTDHIYDTAVAARVDLNRFWNLKIE